MDGSTVLALSQSGRTPDVIEYVDARAAARAPSRWRSPTTTDSELARAADVALPLAAGPERSVAATKTYSNQVAALALFAAHAAGRGAEIADGIRTTADLLEAALPKLEAQARAIALPFASVGRMFTIGRGIEFATAREIALKLLETCRVAAEPFTATGLAHGPVAALDPLFPVWAVASDDATLSAVVEAAERIRAAGATIVASGDAAEALAGAAYVLPGAEASVAAALPAALGRAGPALRPRARAGEGARPRPPGRAEQGDACHVAARRTARSSRSTSGRAGSSRAGRGRPGRRRRARAGRTRARRRSCPARTVARRCRRRHLGSLRRGPRRRPAGALRYSANLDLRDAPLVELLAATGPAPAVFANDLDAAAVGEAGGGTLALLQVGTGIAGRYVVDGRVVPSASGHGGEVGHLRFRDDGLRLQLRQPRLRGGLRQLGRDHAAQPRGDPADRAAGGRRRGGPSRRSASRRRRSSRLRPRHAAHRRRLASAWGETLLDAVRRGLSERVLPDVAAATSGRARPARRLRAAGRAGR